MAHPGLSTGNFPASSGRSTTGAVTLLLAALFFIATVVLGLSMIVRMKESLGWVLHTYDARTQIRVLRTSFIDMSGRLGTAAALNDPTFLPNLAHDLDEQQRTFSRLQSLTQDNPEQQHALARLQPLLAETRTRLLACSTTLLCVPTDPAARREFLSAVWDQRLKTLAVLDAMDNEEQLLLDQRLSKWARLFRFMVIALTISFLSAVFLVFFNLRMLLNEIDRRARSERITREHIDSYRALSGRILELQDTERRKIARDLHDSVGQYLAGTKFMLKQLEREISSSSSDRTALVSEAIEFVDRSLAEIRTISHLLHPPLLDELGLYSAVRWYVEGFAKRSGIQIDLTLDDFVDRLHKDAEIALFRVLQEALTNVHRHSGAKRVLVDIHCNKDLAIITVQDDGRGIPPDILQRYQEGHGGGIGLAGMRERLAELGGTLDVTSSSAGTTIRATLPTNACINPKDAPAAVTP